MTPPRLLLRRWSAKLEEFFRKRFRPDSLATWFLRALRAQHHQLMGPKGGLL